MASKASTKDIAESSAKAATLSQDPVTPPKTVSTVIGHNETVASSVESPRFAAIRLTAKNPSENVKLPMYRGYIYVTTNDFELEDALVEKYPTSGSRSAADGKRVGTPLMSRTRELLEPRINVKLDEIKALLEEYGYEIEDEAYEDATHAARIREGASKIAFERVFTYNRDDYDGEEDGDEEEGVEEEEEGVEEDKEEDKEDEEDDEEDDPKEKDQHLKMKKPIGVQKKSEQTAATREVKETSEPTKTTEVRPEVNKDRKTGDEVWPESDADDEATEDEDEIAAIPEEDSEEEGQLSQDTEFEEDEETRVITSDQKSQAKGHN